MLPPAYPSHVLRADNYSWTERAWRRPSVIDGETVVVEEPGRVLPSADGRHDVCCRSHYFLVVRAGTGAITLRVKHGAGEESMNLGWDTTRVLRGFEAMDSDARFRFCWMLMQTRSDAARAATEHADARWRSAILEGRVRRRKVRGQPQVRVTILEAGRQT